MLFLTLVLNTEIYFVVFTETFYLNLTTIMVLNRLNPNADSVLNIPIKLSVESLTYLFIVIEGNSMALFTYRTYVIIKITYNVKF